MQHHHVLGHLAQETTSATGPKTLDSEASAKQTQEWWEGKLTLSHIHALSKVDFRMLSLSEPL